MKIRSVAPQMQRERSAATTATLTAAARRMFAQDGYEATSLNSVVAMAGVTKGALYHHFDGKRELFRAVCQSEWLRLNGTISAAFQSERDPLRGLYRGIDAFLAAVLDPEVQRILFVDAPSVLGVNIYSDDAAIGSQAQIERALRAAVQAGVIPEQPLETLSHIIHGAICSAGQVVARSAEPSATLAEASAHLRRMLDALLLPG